ncbi:helix-turn-helix domain-containing protein [uncultured Jannaschia sp.]|uniref:helix-turn-helix domain-containing protein n=1 Tax=uncultured Jannaschia sp. TaxID=293347 RepID=UPI002621CCBB|nr:helix-turn-helix domain-containing protein [uncultured Jannaschia sp.]
MAAPGFASPTATARFCAIQPHLEDDVSLARFAAEAGVSERTLCRWLAAYRLSGIAGLERARRSDAGARRQLGPGLEDMIRALATRRPRPTVAAIHRKVATEANAHGSLEPSYAVVADVARGVRAARIAVATDAAAYRDRHELVHRRDAIAPNEMWQADHTMLDALVLDAHGEEVRPWLTVVMDDHSRAVMGYMMTTDAPSAVNTALALRPTRSGARPIRLGRSAAFPGCSTSTTVAISSLNRSSKPASR